MKKTLISIALATMVAGSVFAPVAAQAADHERYYLLTDCRTVQDQVACRQEKLKSGLVIGGFLGLVTGGLAFWGAGGALAAGSTATILGTTVGVETALVGGAAAGAVAGAIGSQLD